MSMSFNIEVSQISLSLLPTNIYLTKHLKPQVHKIRGEIKKLY